MVVGQRLGNNLPVTQAHENMHVLLLLMLNFLCRNLLVRGVVSQASMKPSPATSLHLTELNTLLLYYPSLHIPVVNSMYILAGHVLALTCSDTRVHGKDAGRQEDVVHVMFQ